MIVKVCGITCEEDARLAADAGADALGFIFVEGTPRYVTPAAAAAIIATLPPFVTPVEATRAVWYRVLAGAYVSRDSAAAARTRLWDDNLARPGVGELLRAPYSLVLPPSAQQDSLRRHGVREVDGRPGG